MDPSNEKLFPGGMNNWHQSDVRDVQAKILETLQHHALSQSLFEHVQVLPQEYPVLGLADSRDERESQSLTF